MREELFTELDKNRALPLYYQVSESIESLVRKGEVLPGERLLSEDVLAKRYGVSRPTISKAIAILIRKSILSRERGRGTFIHLGEVRFTLMQELASLHEAMQKDGIKFRTVVLKLEMQKSTRDIAGRLGIKEGARVYFLKRLRYVEDEPFLISDSYLPQHLFRNLEEENFADRSLYDVIERTYKIPIVKTVRTARAVKAFEEEAHLLRIAFGEPLIQLEGVAVSKNDLQVEYFNTKIRGDRGVLSTTLTRIHK
jgi:GntR family transcriptional regulator